VLIILWVALAVAVVASAAGLFTAGRAGLQAWRDLRRAGGALSTALGDLALRLERFSDGVAATTGHAPELEASTARLQASLARLAVLRAAVDEARDAARRVTVFYPRK
jgi:hypothetical protein